MTFYDIIHKWVADNFGQSEADDPSWNIEALAKHLSESNIHPDELSAMTKSRVYNALDQHYVEEDELVRRVLNYWGLGEEDWLKGVM